VNHGSFVIHMQTSQILIMFSLRWVLRTLANLGFYLNDLLFIAARS